jgi:acetyltransferase-like isoleucine patch superfamily enzyme
MLNRLILLLITLFMPNGFRVILLRLVYNNVSKSCRLCKGLDIDLDSNQLYIGDRTYIGKETCIVGQHGNVYIGKDVMIAHRVNICVATHPIELGGG